MKAELMHTTVLLSVNGKRRTCALCFVIYSWPFLLPNNLLLPNLGYNKQTDFLQDPLSLGSLQSSQRIPDLYTINMTDETLSIKVSLRNL